MIWDAAKNEELKQEGRPTFEGVVESIAAGGLLDRIRNESRNYPDQEVLVVQIGGYAHAVPIEEGEHFLVLKTVFPSRKLNGRYGGKRA